MLPQTAMLTPANMLPQTAMPPPVDVLPPALLPPPTRAPPTAEAAPSCDLVGDLVLRVPAVSPAAPESDAHTGRQGGAAERPPNLPCGLGERPQPSMPFDTDALGLDAAQKGALLLSRLLCHSRSSLRRLLLEPTQRASHDEVSYLPSSPDALAPRLVHTMQLLMGSDKFAPLLLCALLPHLAWPGAALPATSHQRLLCCWRLLCLLLVESEQCRRCVACGEHLGSTGGPDSEGNPPLNCSAVLPLLLGLVEHLCEDSQAVLLLLPATRALSVLCWERGGQLGCMQQLQGWLECSEDVRPAVFSALLSPSMPASLRLESLGLLQHVLRRKEALYAFTTPSAGPWPGPATQVVLALSERYAVGPCELRHSKLGIQRDEEAVRQPTALAPHPAWGHAASSSEHPAARQLGHPAAECEAEDSGSESTMPPATALRQAALRLLSSLVTSHATAVDRLLLPQLGLSLPMRLVSALQSQVRPCIGPSRPSTRATALAIAARRGTPVDASPALMASAAVACHPTPHPCCAPIATIGRSTSCCNSAVETRAQVSSTW